MRRSLASDATSSANLAHAAPMSERATLWPVSVARPAGQIRMARVNATDRPMVRIQIRNARVRIWRWSEYSSPTRCSGAESLSPECGAGRSAPPSAQQRRRWRRCRHSRRMRSRIGGAAVRVGADDDDVRVFDEQLSRKGRHSMASASSPSAARAQVRSGGGGQESLSKSSTAARSGVAGIELRRSSSASPRRRSVSRVPSARRRAA